MSTRLLTVRLYSPERDRYGTVCPYDRPDPAECDVTFHVAPDVLLVYAL